MRTLHQPDLSTFPDPEPVSVGDISLLFGVLLCCFVFATVFCSLWMGVPG